MKMNKILVALLIVGMLSCGFSAVFAEDATLDDGTAYTIPEGFSFLKNDAGTVVLATEDQSNAITIFVSPEATSAEAGKQTQIDNGAEFVSENNVSINDVPVVEQIFKKGDLNLAGYLFTVGDKNYVVTYTTASDIPSIDDETNPANVVIKSLTTTSTE